MYFSSFLYGAGSGLLLALAFPDFSLFPLAWIALVPWLLFLAGKPGLSETLTGHLVLSFCYFGAVLYWIPAVLVNYGNLGGGVSAFVFLLLLLLLAFFLLPFTLLCRAAAGHSSDLLLWTAPAFWVLTELVRNYLPVIPFPWGALGYTQGPWIHLIQTVDLGGVYGLSLLVGLGNSGVAALLLKQGRALPATVLILVLLSNLYGAYRLHLWEPRREGELRIAVIQPGIALAGTREYYSVRYFEDLPRYYRRAVASGADWVIFPEAQNPYYFDVDFYFRTFWQREVSRHGIPLLFNGTFTEREEARGFRYFNTAALLDERGEPVYRYAKMILVPFGEFVPFGSLPGFAEALTYEVSSFSPGEVPAVGEVRGIPFSTLICYEAVFPNLGRLFVEEGARLLVNITNDAWFGRTAAPAQHLLKTRFRAVETRRPLVRAANTGISAEIDLRGRLVQSLELDREGMLICDVAAVEHRTLYSRLGDWLSILVVGAAVGTLAVKRRPAALRRSEGGSWWKSRESTTTS